MYEHLCAKKHHYYSAQPYNFCSKGHRGLKFVMRIRLLMGELLLPKVGETLD